MGEPGGLPPMGSHRVGHDWRDLEAAAAEVHLTLVNTFNECYTPTKRKVFFNF